MTESDDIIGAPSPNFDDRPPGVVASVIVIQRVPADDAAALARMCDRASGASSHYLIGSGGGIWRLVDEGRRAWHAGVSHWRGRTATDDHAIGIALSGFDQDSAASPYPAAQVAAMIRLVASVKERHAITRGNVVGQSDIAPTRRRDPGAQFPWHELAKRRLALPRPTKNLMDPMWSQAGFLLALERFGYDVVDPMAAIMAFQRRFRPELIDGEIDAECRMILLALLLPKPRGDD